MFDPRYCRHSIKRVYRRSFDKIEIWKISIGVKCSSDGCLSLVYIIRYSQYLREALTARFIPKGIPEPPCVERVEIQTLTLLFTLINIQSL